jgi:hypothetical protein
VILSAYDWREKVMAISKDEEARHNLAWLHIRESLAACESPGEAVGLLIAALAGTLCHEGLRDCHPEMLEEVLTILRNAVEQDKTRLRTLSTNPISPDSLTALSISTSTLSTYSGRMSDVLRAQLKGGVNWHEWTFPHSEDSAREKVQ